MGARGEREEEKEVLKMLGNLFHFQLKKENQDLKGEGGGGGAKLSKADKKKAEKERKEREKEEKNRVS